MQVPRAIILRSAILVALCSQAAALSVRDLCDLLEKQSVPFDSNAVQRAAFEGALQAVDPLAAVLDSSEISSNKIPSVALAERWEEGVCYLKLSGFHRGGEPDILGQLRAWEVAESYGLILDLREAGGGCLACVDAVAGALDGHSEDTYTVRNGVGDLLETRAIKGSGGFWSSRALMLLIDSTTIGASELFVSILKSRGGVMLIGSSTGGDGALRELMELPGGLSVKLATRWIVLAQAEEGVVRGAIAPDIHVESGAPSRISIPTTRDGHRKEISDNARHDMELMARVMDDAVLARATDILLGLKALDSDGEDAASTVADTSAQSQ